MNETLTRRAFLRTLSVVGTAALLPFAADAQATLPTFSAAGKTSKFALGAIVPVTLPDGKPVFVKRVAAADTSASFHALSALCTHKGCPVAWNAAAKQFQCPCHGGKFDPKGNVVAGPPPRPLPTLAVKVEGGVVMVAA